MVALTVFVIFVYTALFAGAYPFLLDDDTVVVQTKYGEITGHVSNTQFDGQSYQVQKFIGIPYADPPVGQLRFQKSVPYSSRYPTPFLANTYGLPCPQSKSTTDVVYSEDCLHLNVFAPSRAKFGVSSIPAMVWIHGGGFFLGSSNQFDGDVLSGYNDVIVVTLNYRLGVLGFFSTHDANAPGNYGLWDQHLAIQWVKQNIGAFGGDAANVTIFGESAGSSSVIYQMMYPGNKGLFKRAIGESGTIASWAVTDKETNYRNSLDFAQYVGCNDTVISSVLSCLRQKTSDEMTSTAVAVMQSYIFDPIHPVWVPVYDGEFVIAEPADILTEVLDTNTSSSKYAHFFDTDLMIGTNNFDGSVYVAFWLAKANYSVPGGYYTGPPGDIAVYVSDDNFEHEFIPYAGETFFRQTSSKLVNQMIRQEYTAWSDPSKDTLRALKLFDMISDLALNAPTTVTADAHARTNSNTYVYHFSTSSPAQNFPLNVAYHGDEMFFVFGFTTAMNQSFNRSELTQSDINVSKAMMTMWTNFAKSGNPNIPETIRPSYEFDWSQYGVSKKYLEITPEMTQASVKTRLAGRAMELWNVLLPKVQLITSNTCQ